MNERPFLYVGLDSTNQKNNVEFAKKLAALVNSNRYGFKINLDSVADFSPGALSPYNLVREISSIGHRVFVDLKMWNGGRTMRNMAEGCADLGVDIINMYAQAGPKFIRKVADSLEGVNTKLFTLGVLTHYTGEDTRDLYGLSLGDAVEKFAKVGVENGAKGIIVPGTQLHRVKDLNTLKLCPAIRPLWYADKKANSQEQSVTPIEAVNGGALYLVAASPIAKSENPVEALERILAEIS